MHLNVRERRHEDALAVEKKVYTLEGHEVELAKLAGQKITAKGTLKGDTLSLQEVAASK
jgi:hypothetical protein